MRIAEVVGAGRAWRALPRQVRRDVIAHARLGAAHPDRSVARVAADWGRTWWLRGALEKLLFTLIALAALIWDRSPTLLGTYPTNRAADVITPIIVIACIAVIVVRARWPTYVGALNVQALAAHQESAVMPYEVRSAPLPWSLLVALGGSFTVASAAAVWFVRERVGGALSWPDLAYAMACLVPLALITVAAARVSRPGWLKYRPWPGRSVLRVTSAGVELPQLRLELAWSEIRAIDTVPATSLTTSPLGIAIKVRDGAAVLRRATTPAVLRARRMLAREGTVKIPAHWLDGDLAMVLATLRGRHRAGSQT